MTKRCKQLALVAAPSLRMEGAWRESEGRQVVGDDDPGHGAGSCWLAGTVYRYELLALTHAQTRPFLPLVQ